APTPTTTPTLGVPGVMFAAMNGVRTYQKNLFAAALLLVITLNGCMIITAVPKLGITPVLTPSTSNVTLAPLLFETIALRCPIAEGTAQPPEDDAILLSYNDVIVISNIAWERIRTSYTKYCRC